MSIRPGEPADSDAAVSVWRHSNLARRGGAPMPDIDEERVRGYLDKSDAFLVVAEADGELTGISLGMQGKADDGAGPPVPGLCHVSLVFVHPDHWGRGIGKLLVAGVVEQAGRRGYHRAQLWTHADNTRAQRLYEGSGFVRSGREKADDLGDQIVHYELASLPPSGSVTSRHEELRPTF
ncbi:MAG TPA: GNAT family N-acetyltransferase [Mycobacteriales bacterium]|nr:GNAT family N-acetyltransferase [Mycobacteriales bacterium]